MIDLPFFNSQTMDNWFSLIVNWLPFYEYWLRYHVYGKLIILFLYTPFKIFICIHGIIVNSDLVYQHLHETAHLYYLFGSSSKRNMPLCHLVDHILIFTLNVWCMAKWFHSNSNNINKVQI